MLEEYYADAVMAAASASGVDERQVREWVSSQLLTPEGTRRQVLRGPESSAGLDNRAIDRLDDMHLLRGESRQGSVWYELAHDRLVDAVRKDNARWLRVMRASRKCFTRDGTPRGGC